MKDTATFTVTAVGPQTVLSWARDIVFTFDDADDLAATLSYDDYNGYDLTFADGGHPFAENTCFTRQDLFELDERTAPRDTEGYVQG